MSGRSTESWRGLVAVILAVGIGASVLVPLVVGAWRGAELTEAGATLLATVQGAALGALATYLGQGAQRAEENERADRTPAPPDAP